MRNVHRFGRDHNGGDGVEISAQNPDEGPQRRLPVSVASGHPGGEVGSAALGYDLGEVVREAVGGDQRGTAIEQCIELAAVVVGEPGGMPGQPAGGLPDAGRPEVRVAAGATPGRAAGSGRSCRCRDTRV